MPRITNQDVSGSVFALAMLSQVKLPVRASFMVSKAARLIKVAFDDCDAARLKLVNEYGEKNEDGSLKTVRDGQDNSAVIPDMDGFNAAVQSLARIEVDIATDTLSVDDLGNIEIEPSILLTLSWLIDDGQKQ